MDRKYQLRIPGVQENEEKQKLDQRFDKQKVVKIQTPETI